MLMQNNLNLLMPTDKNITSIMCKTKVQHSKLVLYTKKSQVIVMMNYVIIIIVVHKKNPNYDTVSILKGRRFYQGAHSVIK